MAAHEPTAESLGPSGANAPARGASGSKAKHSEAAPSAHTPTADPEVEVSVVGSRPSAPSPGATTITPRQLRAFPKRTAEDALRLVLADAQTSGGLLLCLPAEAAAAALAALHAEGVTSAAVVGAGSWMFGYPFLTSHSQYVELPLIGAVPAASATLFDFGVFSLVLGATSLMLIAIAHQSIRRLRSARAAAAAEEEAA